MWFTRVSLQNPVFATMVMLALVVMGLFSFQRLKVDQFPNIDFPVVVVSTEYPGASPEIVESEVSKKIWPSVIEITLVGIYADTSLALVSMIGSPVIDPPPNSSLSFAHLSSKRECR